MNINKTKIGIVMAERGITQSTLGERAGLSRQSVSAILTRGTCAPKSAGKLARALNVSVEEILEVK